MSQLSIRPIPLTAVEAPQSMMTYMWGFDRRTTMGLYLWYIEGAGSKIVVDTGCGPEMFQARVFSARQVQTLEQGLAKVGLEPGDIDLVIATHLHPDHIHYARRFPRARVLAQEAELAFARNPHPMRVLGADSYDPALLEGVKVEAVSGDCEVCDGVLVLHTPGHTRGSQSVAVKTSAGIAVITGFCATDDNFEPPDSLRKIMPFIVPGVHIDAVAAFDSMARVKQVADVVIPLHSPRYLDKDRVP